MTAKSTGSCRNSHQGSESPLFPRESLGYNDQPVQTHSPVQANSLKINSLAYSICYPLQTSDEESAISYGSYLASETAAWMPDSVKNLLENTLFITSVDEVEDALLSDKKQVVWNVNDSLLLNWQKEENNTWSLKVFCLPPFKGSTLSGGIFSIISAIDACVTPSKAPLSEWTSGLKKRIDPLFLHFKNLPGNVFSREWLEALGQENWTSLFAPLEEHRTQLPPLPKSDDEEGYMKRFMTPARSEKHTWWLYKAWMRAHLPIEDYKQYHFLHRFTLFTKYERRAAESDRSTCYEIATKLMRAFLKGTCVLDGGIKDQLQLLINKHAQTLNQEWLANSVSLMPPRYIRSTHLSQPAIKEVVGVNRIPAKVTIPFQWNTEGSVDARTFIDINDSVWDISVIRKDAKVDAVLDLAARYKLLSGIGHFSPYALVQMFKRLTIFKRLVAQIHVDIAESLCLIPRENLTWNRAWEDPLLYNEWLSYYKELIPKNSIYINCQRRVTRSCNLLELPQNESLAKLFICTLDDKTENDLSPRYVEEFSSLTRPTDQNALSIFPKTALFLSKLKECGGLEVEGVMDPHFDIYTSHLNPAHFGCAKASGLDDRKQDHITNMNLFPIVQSRELSREPKFQDSGGTCIEPRNYLEESQRSEGECYLHPTKSVTLDCPCSTLLPDISPVQALINYSQLQDVWKYEERSLKSLMEDFFQEAWTTEELKAKSKRQGFNYGLTKQEGMEDQRVLMMAISEGRLPWAESLKDPQFQRFFETFLKDEYTKFLHMPFLSATHFPALIALMRLSVYAIRICPALQVPDFEELVVRTPKRYQQRYSYNDSGHEKFEELIKNTRLYLFWLYAEQGRPSEAFRPLSKDWLSFSNDRLGSLACANWLRIDERYIFAHLKNLPDLPEIEYPENIDIQIIPHEGVTAAAHASQLGLLFPGWGAEEDGEDQIARLEKLINAQIAQKSSVSTTDPSKMEHRLDTNWWTGEKVVVAQNFSRSSSYDANKWKLQDRPHLFWRMAAPRELHGNELVDESTGNVVAHVFHVDLENKYCFAIPYEQGKYSPNTLEESLCLLLQYCKINNRVASWKAILQLPKMPHHLSPVALQLMQQIVSTMLASKTESFENFGLTMQVLERFHRWAQSPTLNLKLEEMDTFTEICSDVWELYRNLQQNIPQQHLLEPIQRQYLSNLMVCKGKEMAVEMLEKRTYLYAPLSRYLKKLIKAQQPTRENVAWHRSFKKVSIDTLTIFNDEHEKIINGRYPEDTLLSYLNRLSVRIAAVFTRFLGIRYVWPERLTQIEAHANICENYILTPQDINSREQKRLLLAVERQNHNELDIEYCFEIVDWALIHGITKYDNETPAQFIARVEQLKHVRNVFYNLLALVGVHFVRRIYTMVRSIYNLLPQKVTVQADAVRDPFELYRGRNIYPRVVRDINAPVVYRTPQEILELANKTSLETRATLAATLQEPIEWSHIEGLFIQNAMKRLIEINPALTEEDCDLIDSSVRYALIDPARSYSYDPQENSLTTRALLVFEKTTNMQVRPDQIEKLQALFTRKPNGNYANIAMQMAMGAGKTSVLASIVLLQAAVPGRISIFVPPVAQFETLATMLTKWQKDRFQQEVIPIKMSFDHMTNVSSLEWLHTQLHQAKELGHVLLLHPETLHNLRLAWLSCTDPEVLEILYAIRSELKNHGDALFDEIDKAQDPLIDSSMAYGDEKQPSMRYLKQFVNLILLHKQDPVLWDALCKNTPEKMDAGEYKEFQYNTMAPVLARQFLIPSEHQESFCRYVVGVADAQDAAFIKYLDKHEARDEIAQYKHWLEDILPFTIFREKGRHYGRSSSSAEVVPYIGVGAPGTTKFAQLAEEVSYYWLTALSSDLDQNKFQEILQIFKFRFDRYKNNAVAQEKVSKEFYELTSFDLKRVMESSEELNQALIHVNAAPERKLKCEVYLAHHYVKYYEAQITSTSQDALNMFSTHRGFSGTFPGYIHAFDHIVVPDSESDLSVIHAMKAHNEPSLIVDHAEDYFDYYVNDRHMGGLIDSGGLFRDFTNDQVAEMTLNRLPHIDTVLFFGKGPQSEAPDVPMIMQRNGSGGTITHVIGSTEEHVLKAWGVEKERLFVFYDQRHCEATNVIQMPDRLNAITFGMHSTKRDLLQGIMRLRQYKEQGVHQSLVYVMQRDTAEKLFGNQPPSADLILEKSKEIEQEETKKRTFRTLYHRIDSAFCEVIEDYISTHLTGKKCEELRAFILHNLLGPSAYKQFGAISLECNTVDKLMEYMDGRVKEFTRIYPGKLPSSLIDKLQEIKALIPNIRSYLPEKTLAKQLGQEQQQEVKQEVEQEQQQEQQTERVLSMPSNRGVTWEEVCNYKSISLSDYYGSMWRGLYLVSSSFDAKLFEGLLASENFVHTYKKAYALNHPNQKRANYVLLERKNNRLATTLLSGYDYHNYHTGKRELPENSSICFWKPSQEGNTQYIKGTLKVSDEDIIQWNKIRLQIAFLNGDVSYIVDHLTDLSEQLKSEHFAFLRSRIKYWQLQGDAEDKWRVGKDILSHQNALQLIAMLEIECYP